MELAELCGIVDALSRDERRRALCGDPEQKNWRNTAEFGCVVAIFFAGLRNGGRNDRLEQRGGTKATKKRDR